MMLDTEQSSATRPTSRGSARRDFRRPIGFNDVVGAVRFLISSDGAMAHGQTLLVDGDVSVRA